MYSAVPSAVFEAIVNAVAHRDYAMHGTRIRQHLFADQLELSTPGGLPNRLTGDNMEVNSITRNYTLVNLLSLYYPSDPLSKRQNLIGRRTDHPDVWRKPALLRRQPRKERPAGAVQHYLKK